MTEFELLGLVIELETRVGAQDQYFVTGLFAIVMVVYLFGQKMTKGMVAITCVVYSTYAFWNMFAVAAAMERILAVQNTWPSTAGLPPASEHMPLFLALFWMFAWAASMFFMVLVLRQRLRHPMTSRNVKPLKHRVGLLSPVVSTGVCPDRCTSSPTA